MFVGLLHFSPFSIPPPTPSINERQAPDRLADSKAEQAETQKKRRKGLFSEVWRPSTFNPPPPLSQLAGCYPSAHPALLALGFLLLVTANSLQVQECACGLPREPKAQSFNMLPPFSPRASPAQPACAPPFSDSWDSTLWSPSCSTQAVNVCLCPHWVLSSLCCFWPPFKGPSPPPTTFQVTLFVGRAMNIYEGPTVCHAPWATGGVRSKQNRPNSMSDGSTGSINKQIAHFLFYSKCAGNL